MKGKLNIVFIALLIFQLVASSYVAPLQLSADAGNVEGEETIHNEEEPTHEEDIVDEDETSAEANDEETDAEEEADEDIVEENDDEDKGKDEGDEEESSEPENEEGNNDEEAADEEAANEEETDTSEEVRPLAEVDKNYFDLAISEVTDLEGNAYGEGNPLKPDDEFWVKTSWELKNGHDYKAGDTATYQLPEELALSAGDEGELTDALGEVVATYVISQDGEVTLTFTDFVQNNSEVNGWLEIRAELNKNVVEEEDGKVVIGPIDDEGSQELPIDRSPVDKTVEKQGQPNKSYNADEIEWTVTINKNAHSLNDVTLEDLLPAGTEYVDGSLTAVKQGATINGTPVGEATNVSVTPSVADGTLSIPLGDIDEVYTITYTTKVTDMDEKNFKNNVSFKDADLEDTSAEATVTINRGEPLDKGAVKNYDPKTGIIEWYLDINFDQKDLTDVTLADSWANSEAAGKMALVDGTVKFQEMTIDEDGNATAIGEALDPSAIGATLVKEEDGFKINGITIDKAYRVVYQTKATDRQLDGFRIENTASFNGTEKGAGYNVGQYIGVKSAGKVDYAEKTIEWEVKVNLDEVVMNNVVITDTIGQGLTLIPDSITVTHGGSAHDFDLIDETDNPFKVDVGDISKEVVVKYKTTFDADNVPNQQPTNTADVSWTNEDGKEFNKELNTNTQLNDETVQASWKNASYNPDTKEITWTIIANYRENAYEDFTISDTPLGNQKLVESSLKVIEMEVNADGDHIDQGPAKNADVSIDGNSFHINLGQTDKAYKVVYRTSLAGLEDVAKEYANEAQVKDGNEVLADLDAKVSVFGDRKYGDKRGQQDGRRVDWSIDVNLAQEKISNLALEDTISDNQAYIEDTIKVYNAKVNADGTVSKTDLVDKSKYELEVNETDFNVAWNDDVERAFVVEYSTLFFAKDAEKVNNSYKITGDGISEEDTDASDRYEVEIRQTSGGGAEGTAGYLLLHKIDATYGQSEQALAGIKFELIDTSNDKVLKTVRTDADGYVDFGRLLFGEYKLREVNAPDGYIGFDEEIIEIDQAFTVDESDPKDFVYTIENYQANHDVELVKRDIDGYLLEGVEFTLYTASGEEVTVESTDENGEITFEDLEVGNYYIQETKALNGFELDDTKHEFEITADQKEAIQLDLVNEYKETSVTLKKNWQDEGDTSLRPDSIKINLFQNGVAHGTYEITEGDNWELTVNGLHAEDEDGNPYEYTITEQEVPGYEPSYEDDGLTVTNTREDDRDITITKSWIDKGNENRRPESITVELSRSVDGGDKEVVENYDISPENDWKETITDLPMFDEDGNLYHYEIEEKELNYPELIEPGNEPADYETTVDGFDITNRITGTTKVYGVKNWNDDGDVDNRPDSITINLYKNGEKIADQVIEPDENGEWSYEFDNLERYDENGRAYHYIIEEEPVFGYQTTMGTTTPPGSPVMRYDLWNTRVGNTGLFGSKTWLDNEDAENTRPESIEVEVYQNGELFSTEELSEENGWMYGSVGLPAYDSLGKAYEYTVKEIAVDGYETSYDGYDITNRLVGETEVSVEKVWKGEAAENVRIYLYANDDFKEAVDLSEENDWKHTFAELPQYDSQGAAIAYTITEVDMAGYASTITGDADEGFVVTNTRTGTTEVAVEKVWQGSEEDSATIYLLANGERVDGQAIDLNEENDWQGIFTDLEAFDEEGQPIEYTVEEKALDGYSSEVTGDATEGFTVTNTRAAEISVDITKSWNDDGAEKSDRPDHITVNLLANDDVVDEYEVTAENDWTLTIADLPKYDEVGEEIDYSISEHDVPGYEAVIDGFDITNTRQDVEKSIEINKAWVGDEAADRPESIEVELFRSVEGADKEYVETYHVTAENDWSLTIDALSTFDANGKAYTYTVEEIAVDGYESKVNGFDITNTLIEDPEDPEDPKEDPKDPKDPADKDDSTTKDPDKDSTDEEKGDNDLPNTATNTYNFIAIGLGVLALGLLILFFTRRKQQQ